MPFLHTFQGRSQFDSDIRPSYRSSACGPVTASVILNYLNAPLSSVPIDKLYKRLGTTPVGLFTWRFVRRLQKLLGPDWVVDNCLLPDVLAELDAGRPVAAKFDKWFTFKWKESCAFDYHWVPVIGYERQGNDVILAIHDNGSPSSSGNVRFISYLANRSVLSFVKIAPARIQKGH